MAYKMSALDTNNMCNNLGHNSMDLHNTWCNRGYKYMSVHDMDPN